MRKLGCWVVFAIMTVFNLGCVEQSIERDDAADLDSIRETPYIVQIDLGEKNKTEFDITQIDTKAVVEVTDGDLKSYKVSVASVLETSLAHVVENYESFDAFLNSHLCDYEAHDGFISSLKSDCPKRNCLTAKESYIDLVNGYMSYDIVYGFGCYNIKGLKSILISPTPNSED